MRILRRLRPLAIVATALAAGAAGVALAGGARSFRQTTAKDFEEGEATGSMILATGDVVPGMKTTRLPAVDAAFVWCAAAAAGGRTAYFGTGDPGRVHAVPLGGAGSAARKLAELDAPWVTSLAVRADGTVLAGTTPGGRVVALDPATGAARPLAKIGAEHVWALVHDARSVITYAAGGGPGKVFAIDGKGAVRVLWDSGDKHVVALLDGGGGALLAGTSEEAILYRVRPDGRAEALHDFEADEVRAIARAGGATFLAVNDFDKPADGAAAPATGGPQAAKGTRIQIASGPSPASAGSLPRPGQVKSRGAVYRLGDDGRIEQVLTLADGYFTALLAGDAGEIYAAAGTQGKVYRIAPDRTAALVVDLSERQALALLRTADGFLVGTGDVGGVYRARPAAGAEATYLSKVLDAEVSSRWGMLRWTGSAAVEFESRSGNTAKPDDNWGAWRKLAGVYRSGPESEGAIASPAARYLQYRATLAGKDAALRETSIHYIPQNQRARVTEVTSGDGTGGGTPIAGAGTTPGAPSPVAGSATRVHSSVLKLRWKVENPDGDDLVFRLSYRADGETVWRPLGGPDPLSKAEYDWNTDSVPDGRYLVRVWVSDEKVTPGDRALDSTFESPPFLVDNTRPDVQNLAWRPPALTGRAADAASAISLVEYSVDGNEFRPATPADGILDQRVESFSLRLPALPAGPHVVTVRAADSADNLGAARIVVETPK